MNKERTIMGIEENELLGFILDIGTLIFVLVNYGRLSRIKGLGVLGLSFSILLISGLMTNVEGLFPEQSRAYQTFNLLEHLCFMTWGLWLCFWCWRVFKGRRSSP